MGVDAGGTHTRASIVTLDGVVAGHGSGPGANPNSGGDTAKALETALIAALGSIDPALVVGGVFGIAGAGAAGRARMVTAANAAWRAAGLSGAPDVVTDIAVAYAAGSAEPAGIVVFAGTGAGAAVIDDGEIKRRADAYGWLIGDEGSAVWIGREAVRASMRAYDRRGPATVLAATVPRALLGEAAEPLVAALPAGILPGTGEESGENTASGPDLPQAIIKEVYSGPPSALGGLAPLVSSAAEEGDTVARSIVTEAAECLLRDVDAVRPALAGLNEREGRGGHGLVVAGSLLDRGPVADAVRAGLRSRFGVDPAPAGEGTLGAARLAVRRLGRPA